MYPVPAADKCTIVKRLRLKNRRREAKRQTELLLELLREENERKTEDKGGEREMSLRRMEPAGIKKKAGEQKNLCGRVRPSQYVSQTTKVVF